MNQTRWILCVVFGVLHNRDMKMAYLHVIYNQRHSSSILLISVLYLLCYAEGTRLEVCTCVGDDAVLPCEVHSTINATDMDVEWFRTDRIRRHEHVHFQKFGKEVLDGEKNPSYINRTSLFNMNLTIHRVNSSDEAIYKCLITTFPNKHFEVELIVGDCLIVNVSIGDVAVLPCTVDSTDGTHWDVHWYMQGQPVHCQSYGKEEDREDKNRSYYNRSSISGDEWEKGNVSLKLTGVKLTDDGIYKCLMLNPKKKKQTLVRLIVEDAEQHAEDVPPTPKKRVKDAEQHAEDVPPPPKERVWWARFISIALIIVFIIVFSGLVYKSQSILELVSRTFHEESPVNVVSEDNPGDVNVTSTTPLM